jgi:hypothetical protein
MFLILVLLASNIIPYEDGWRTREDPFCRKFNHMLTMAQMGIGQLLGDSSEIYILSFWHWKMPQMP